MRGRSQRAAISSMRMFARGVDDSPIAKRGCRPFSRRRTLRPCLRRIIARSEPAKPEPTTATSVLTNFTRASLLRRPRKGRGGLRPARGSLPRAWRGAPRNSRHRARSGQGSRGSMYQRRRDRRRARGLIDSRNFIFPQPPARWQAVNALFQGLQSGDREKPGATPPVIVILLRSP